MAPSAPKLPQHRVLASSARLRRLTVFDCVRFEHIWLLRADPAMRCWDDRWYVWAALAMSGAGVFCVFLPLIALVLAFVFFKHGKNGDDKRLVQASHSSEM